MIDLNEPFNLSNRISESQLVSVGLTSGVQSYVKDGILYFDLLSKRKATIYHDGKKFYVNNEETYITSLAPKGVAYGFTIDGLFYYEILPANEILNTTSNLWNVNLPIVARAGVGEQRVTAVAGPYLFNESSGRCTLADAEITFELNYNNQQYQLMPTLSTDVKTQRGISPSDLNIAPEQPPISNLLPNLFRDITTGTFHDVYVLDEQHKIKITLTHSSSYG